LGKAGARAIARAAQFIWEVGEAEGQRRLCSEQGERLLQRLYRWVWVGAREGGGVRRRQEKACRRMQFPTTADSHALGRLLSSVGRSSNNPVMRCIVCGNLWMACHAIDHAQGASKTKRAQLMGTMLMMRGFR
jgi:hypothetical protein